MGSRQPPGLTRYPSAMKKITYQHRQFCEYSLTFKGNTPRTIKWYQSTFGHFLKWADIECISEISYLVIKQYIVRGKMEKQWKARTIRNRLMALKLFLDWGFEERLISENPAKEVPLPKLDINVPEHLTEDQAFDLLEWTRNFRYTYKSEKLRSIAIIYTLIFTGIRAQELLNLNVEDIRLDDQSLFVRGGKGKKDRLIPLLDHQHINVLKAYLKDRDRLKRSNPRFLLQVRSDKPMTYKALQLLVEKLRKRSGIYFFPHMLRHTFATLMLEGGADLVAIKEMMGHSDIKTTMIYLTATTAHLRSEARKHPLSSIRATHH